jgi:hypothetical protein
VVAKVPIGKPKQRALPITQVIDAIGGTRLRDTCPAATAQGQNRVKWLRRQRVSQRESRVGRNYWIVMELKNVQRILRRAVAAVVIL